VASNGRRWLLADGRKNGGVEEGPTQSGMAAATEGGGGGGRQDAWPKEAGGVRKVAAVPRYRVWRQGRARGGWGVRYGELGAGDGLR
jgi:hypothetical protein